MRIVTLLYQRLKSCNWSITPIILALLFLSPIKMFSQSGNLDQIRNGPASDPSKNFWDDFDSPMHVNGNAGASNAHYIEGHSISYRSLITGAVKGTTYEYLIEYDTKHSGRMAIDYLTHYQRLEPHQLVFGHLAEAINPLIFESGSKEYILNVKGDSMGFTIPAPFQSDPNTPKDGEPQTSFGKLSTAEKQFMIYNGVIQDISYVFQQSLENGKTESMTRVRIKFLANDDSVVLAWGGHIASQLDWGFLSSGVPRSASGISGSPYHMRQISMNIFEGANISGVGNQDRSLSANAVFPPPSCSISNAQFACPETSSLTYNYTGSNSGATFLWTLSDNTAGATIQNGANTASSVVIVPSGTDFIPGGSFDLTLAVTVAGVTTQCSLDEAGTIHDVQVSATATPGTIDLTASNHTSQLNAAITSGPSGGTYAFSWAQDPTSGGSLSANNVADPIFTATEAGTYQFIVTATLQGTLNCVAKDTVYVIASSSAPPCGISGPDPVCPGSTHTYKYDPNGDGVADPIPANFTATWSFASNDNKASFNGALDDTTVSVTAGAACNKGYTLKIELVSNSGFVTVSCTKAVNVNVTSTLDITCPEDKDVACADSKDPDNTGKATAADNGCGVKIYYKDVITRTWIAEDACGNRDTCTQVITVTDSCVIQDFTDNSARKITNTGTAPATQGFTSPVITSPVKSQIKNSPAISPKTTSLNTGTKDLQVQAFPNPFSNTVNFRFVSPVSGRAILEVFNIQGQRVGIAFDGLVGAGVFKSVQFSTRLTNQALIYKLKVGDKSVRGTVLELKR